MGLGLSQQILAYFSMSTFIYASFALTLTIKFLSKLEKSVMKLGVSKDPHNPTRPPETARTEGPRAAPNSPTVGHGLKSAQPEFCGSDPGFKIFHPENPNRPN